ncbi:MAG: ABC transporter substrate-binding protein [Chloroflexi bacterium]|nr:ABC transporter substrate-binding protein [Chloroflexota bacterium]
MVLLLAACAPTASPAPPTPALPARLVVTLADTATSPLYLPVSLAAALKYFDAEGLAVDLRYAPGGDVPAGSLFAGQSVDYAVRNRQWRVIAALTRTPAVALLVRADLKASIASPAALKGRRIGVSAIGAHTHIIATALLQKAGLATSDYTIVPVGASTLAAAFESHSIDAGFGYEPYVSQLLADGKATVLADLRTPEETERWLGGGYPYTALLADAGALAAYPATAQKMVNALARAQAYMRARTPDEVAAVLPDAATGRDKQQWVAAYRALRPAFAPDARSDGGGIEMVVSAVRLLGLIKPAEAIEPASLFDNTYADIAAQQIQSTK